MALLIFEHIYSSKLATFQRNSKTVSGSDFTVVIKNLPKAVESTSLTEQLLEIFITTHIDRLTKIANLQVEILEVHLLPVNTNLIQNIETLYAYKKAQQEKVKRLLIQDKEKGIEEYKSYEIGK